MAEPIGPGDWVEFVGNADGSGPATPPAGYRFEGHYGIGSVHCVTAITPAMRVISTGRICPGIKVTGVRAIRLSDGAHVFTPLDQWRPIYRPKAELIQSLLAPAPKRSRKTKEPA